MPELLPNMISQIRTPECKSATCFPPPPVQEWCQCQASDVSCDQDSLVPGMQQWSRQKNEAMGETKGKQESSSARGELLVMIWVSIGTAGSKQPLKKSIKYIP